MTEKKKEDPPDDGAVLSPDDLDISTEDNVVEIDEGRYVISPSGSQPNATDSSIPDRETANDEVENQPSEELTGDDVHEWLEDRLDSADSKYAFDVTASFEGSVEQKSLFSNDVVTTFENLVIWYAQHVGGDTPIEDVLGILLVESNLAVRFPADSLEAFARTHGLDGQDSIDGLLDVARDAGGIRFSPGDG